MHGGGWYWTSWEGRAVAWLTLRGRRWSVAVLALVILAWGAGEWVGLWGERKRASMATLPAGVWNQNGAARFIYWNARESREMDSLEVDTAELEGRNIGVLEVFVSVSETPVEWWGRVVGAKGEASLRSTLRESGPVSQTELLRIAQWGSTVDQLISSSTMYTGARLRAASAAGPATATRISAWLVGATIVERGSVWALWGGGCWLALALYAEIRRSGAMRSYRERGMCWACGYELGVASLKRCPECGVGLGGHDANRA